MRSVLCGPDYQAKHGEYLEKFGSKKTGKRERRHRWQVLEWRSHYAPWCRLFPNSQNIQEEGRELMQQEIKDNKLIHQCNPMDRDHKDKLRQHGSNHH